MSDRALVLDDDPARGKWFLRHWPCALWVQTVEDAILALRTGEWDPIFLDHDLGEGCREGIEVASMIAFERLQLQATVVVHSANPVGAARMVQVLRRSHPNVSHMSFPRLRQLIDR